MNRLTFNHRDREILKLIAAGYKDNEIADELHIDVTTLKKHLGDLMKKSNLHNVSSVINYALDKGLISIYEVLGSRYSKR
jgi:DNA-binding NarL/FixJ family response regulator